MPKLLSSLALLFAAMSFLACSSNNKAQPSPTPTSGVTAPGSPAVTAPASTSTPAASASSTPAPGGGSARPAAPSNLQVAGALPDLRTPVPPGQGELGRITVSWQDHSNNEDGFRILQDCGGAVSTVTEVPANTTSIGPIQVCRPGRVGVAAFNAAGTSDIAWSP